MKRIVWMLMGCICLAGALAPSARADDAAVRKQFDALYAKFMNLYKQKDAKGMLAMTTDDFTWSQGGTTHSKQDMVTILAQQIAMTKKITKVSQKLESISIKGNLAYITSSSVLEAVISGPASETDPKIIDHQLLSTDTAKDVWAKSGATWKLKSTKSITSKTKIDGREIDPATGKPVN